MIHNKISLERFFEVGGLCEIRYTEDGHLWSFDYPESVAEFNAIMKKVYCQTTTFRWNRWTYRPVLDERNHFHYLEAYERLQ